MSIVITNNAVIEKIVEVAEKLTTEEQEIFLAQMNAAYLLKENKPFSKAKNVKPLTMTQIDAIKHKVRKEYQDNKEGKF
jgi:hypothetical protein